MIYTSQDIKVRQPKRHANGLRSHAISRIETRESDQDIREALQSTSASSYVFEVQGYQWEVQS
jgi:hypothetical protein